MKKILSKVPLILSLAIGVFLFLVGEYVWGGIIVLGGYFLFVNSDKLINNSFKYTIDQLLYVLAYIIGISAAAIAGYLAFFLGGFIFAFMLIEASDALELFLNIILMGPVAGFAGWVAGYILGFAQWFVIGKMFSGKKKWLKSSSIGAALGFILVGYFIMSNYASVAIAILLTIIGLSQWWFVIKPQSLQNSWWVGGILVSGILGSFAFGLAVPFIFAIIIGLVLPKFLSQPVVEEQSILAAN